MILQDLHARASCGHPRRKKCIQAPQMQSTIKLSMQGRFEQYLHKIFSQRLAQDCARTPRGFHWTSSRSAQVGPRKIMQNEIVLGSPRDPCRGTCTRSCKDYFVDFSEIFTRSSQDLLAGLVQDHASCTRSRKEGILDYTRIATRSSQKDPRKRTSAQGFHQDPPTRSYIKDLYQDHVKTS